MSTKIVIVSGQEFSVPADTPDDQIREALKAQGFADVASATIQKGKRTVEGVEVETVEFVKKVGTKGISARDLAALVTSTPADDGEPGLPLVPARLRPLLRRLAREQLTIEEARESPDLLELLNDLSGANVATRTEVAVCRALDALPAVSVG